jgi:pilus assembly protein CpaF
MIKLTITEKGGEPKVLSFDKDEISIGRVTGNDIVLPKGNVSKRHSKISSREGLLEVADLKSTNGTYVNGRKIADPVHVTPSDKIYVGDFMIVLDSEMMASTGNGHSEAVSASRRLPVPPPPPPARGTTGANVPLGEQDDDGEASDAGDEDDESLGLAVRPPRAGRLPPPPPPPRRTPMGTALDDIDDDELGSAAPAGAPREPADRAPSEIDAAGEETGAQGGPALFEHGPTHAATARRPGDDDDDEGDDEGEAFREAPVTGSRGGARASARPAAEPSNRTVEPPGRVSRDSGPLPTTDRSGRSPTSTEPATDARVAEALDKMLADPTVSAIVIRGPEMPLVERGGRLEPASAPFGDLNALADVIWRLATMAIPPPAPDNPVVDVRLVDGTRIAAAFPPAAPAGICAVIRKPALPDRSLADLNPGGATPSEVQVVLEAAVRSLRNVMVTGDASAVTAVLGALAAAIPTERRVVSVGAGLGRARGGWTELAAGADMAGLVRVAAAFRPDQLLIADAAGPEVLDVLLAAARGQEGLIFGLPARTTAEAIARTEALVARNPGGAGVAPLAASCVDLVVHAVSLPSGGARIAEVAELRLDGAGKLGLDAALSWRSDGGPRSGSGVLDVVGLSARLADAMAARGYSVPSNLVRRASA